MQVDELMTLERYSHVMHLTSQVSGELRRRARRRSTCCGPRCPPGTVAGAPKVRAMEIIDELEPVKRGPVRRRRRLRRLLAATSTPRSPSARCSSARTGASVQAGAGIVADSVPDDEDLECRNKAAALLAAVPAARRMTAKRAEEGTPA